MRYRVRCYYRYMRPIYAEFEIEGLPLATPEEVKSQTTSTTIGNWIDGERYHNPFLQTPIRWSGPKDSTRGQTYPRR